MALVANAAKGVSATYLAVLVALSLYFATIQGMGVSTLAWAILFFYSISWALTVFYDVDKGSIHMVYKDDWGVFILFTLIAISSLTICMTHWFLTLEGIGSAIGWLFLQARGILAKTSPITLPAYIFLRVTKKVYSYAWFFDALALFAFGVDINILWHAAKGP